MKSSNKLPSIEELRQYHRGELDDSRSHEIEMEAQYNPLLREAIEGYREVPAYDALPLFSEVAKGVVGTSKVAGLLSFVWWRLNGWIVGLILGGVAVVIFSVSGNEEITEASIDPVTELQAQGVVESQEQEFVVVESNESVQSKDVQIKLTLAPATAGTTNAQQPAVMSNDLNIAPIKTKNATLAQSQPMAAATQQPKQILGLMTVFVDNYKVADYSELYQRQSGGFDLEDIGTAANYENKQSKNKRDYLNESERGSTPYLEYVRHCLALMDKGYYEAAAKQFSVILKQYPRDVNAQFYAALCHYKSGDFESALIVFDQAQDNVIRVFKEEAAFYEAKALKALKRCDEAKALFGNIIASGGFYAEQAQKEYLICE